MLPLLFALLQDDYETYRAQVRELAKSDTVAVSSLGRTLADREVFLLTIGTGQVHEKPAILVVGIHRDGWTLALALANLLAGSKLLDRLTFYVLPRPNPGNGRKTDDDRDGEMGEDPPDDLNGDGAITMMRVEDDTGEWMPHPEDPRVLVQADPKKGERGKYRLYKEGKDDDGDGEFNEDASEGVDFNRNFTHRYPYFAKGAGPNAVSEIETRAVADFAFSRPNIAAVFTLTTEDNLFHPWKPNGDSDRAPVKWAIHSEDAPYHEFVAERYREIHGGKDAPAPTAAEGSFSEWAYFHYGRWSFAARGGWLPKSGEVKDARGADQVNALRVAPESFVEWAAVKHPDFPDRRVEVGGFKPAPAKELHPEKHLAFLEKLADLFPRLRVELKIEHLGEGTHRITATIVNDGYLPTMGTMAAIVGDQHALQARIDLPKGARLATGHPRVGVDRLGGHGGKVERSWLVVGARGSVTVTAWSPSVGTASKSAEVK